MNTIEKEMEGKRSWWTIAYSISQWPGQGKGRDTSLWGRLPPIGRHPEKDRVMDVKGGTEIRGEGAERWGNGR